MRNKKGVGEAFMHSCNFTINGIPLDYNVYGGCVCTAISITVVTHMALFSYALHCHRPENTPYIVATRNSIASSSCVGSSFHIEFKELYWSIVILNSIIVLTTDPDLDVIS